MIKYDKKTIPERNIIAVLIGHLVDKGVIDLDEFTEFLDEHIEEENKKYEGKTMFD